MVDQQVPNDWDVIVVGSGVNGLASAALLAKRGKRVLVLEANPTPGGAVASAAVTLDGFTHDLFAMNLGLFASGPAMAQLGDDLARHGFELVPSQAPFCSVFDDGSMIGVEADGDRTEQTIASIAPQDLAAWQALSAKLDRWLPHIGAMLSADLPSAAAAKALWKARRDLGTDGVLDIARLALLSTRAFTDEHFTDPRVKALLAAWGMHLDFAPDIPGGALFSFLETFGGEKFGMVIGRGGARSLVDALVAVIEEGGGEIRCGSAVETISTDGGRASGVVLANGDRITSDAVVSNVNPRLMPDLLPSTTLSAEASRVRTFRPGLSTMMIHCALDELPPWTAHDARRFNYVHLGGTVDDMALTYQQAAAGKLPERPVLVVGQPTVTDPSRAPEGKHVLWVQVRVLPHSLAQGQPGWDDVAEEYADHVMAILEEYAPGLGNHVLRRHVISPAGLEAANRNLIGGDSLGGSHHPAQFFFLRPGPGWAMHHGPVRDLYLCGAGTWPGAGVGGTSGAIVADLIAPPGGGNKVRAVRDTARQLINRVRS